MSVGRPAFPECVNRVFRPSPEVPSMCSLLFYYSDSQQLILYLVPYFMRGKERDLEFGGGRWDWSVCAPHSQLFMAETSFCDHKSAFHR